MSRQLLDQEQFEKTLNSLLQRQSTLEQRASVLAGDPSTTGTVKPARTPAAMPPAEKPVRVSPISDTVIFVAPADREAGPQSRELPMGGTRIAERAAAGGVNGMLARISLSLDKVEQKQAATLTDLEERIDTRARRIHSVLSDLGAMEQLADRSFPSNLRNRGPALLNANCIASMSHARRSTGTAARFWRCRYANPSSARSI